MLTLFNSHFSNPPVGSTPKETTQLYNNGWDPGHQTTGNVCAYISVSTNINTSTTDNINVITMNIITNKFPFYSPVCVCGLCLGLASVEPSLTGAAK